MGHVTRMSGSCCTYDESRVTRINDSHVAHVNESCHAWAWVMSHMYQSCYTYESVMSHMWVLSHVSTSHVTHTHQSCSTYESVMSHIWVMSCVWTSHITHTHQSCSTYESVMSHIWVMSCVWTSHVTHTHPSCSTYESVMLHRPTGAAQHLQNISPVQEHLSSTSWLYHVKNIMIQSRTSWYSQEHHDTVKNIMIQSRHHDTVNLNPKAWTLVHLDSWYSQDIMIHCTTSWLYHVHINES